MQFYCCCFLVIIIYSFCAFFYLNTSFIWYDMYDGVFNDVCDVGEIVIDKKN